MRRVTRLTSFLCILVSLLVGFSTVAIMVPAVLAPQQVLVPIIAIAFMVFAAVVSFANAWMAWRIRRGLIYHSNWGYRFTLILLILYMLPLFFRGMPIAILSLFAYLPALVVSFLRTVPESKRATSS